MSPAVDTLHTLKFNLERLMQSGRMNRAQLSRAAGYQDNKVTTVLNGSSMPSIDFAVKMASVLEAEIGELFRDPTSLPATEMDATSFGDVEQESTRLANEIIQSTHRKLVQMGERPSMDLITSWWQQTGGRLEACEQISPYFDVVGVPQAGEVLPSVHSVGPKSLSAHTLKSHDSNVMDHFLRTLSEADAEELNQCITTVHYSGTGLVTPQQRIVELPGMAAPVDISFVRLMLPVTDSEGAPHILNFSTLVSESTLTKSSGFLQ